MEAAMTHYSSVSGATARPSSTAKRPATPRRRLDPRLVGAAVLLIAIAAAEAWVVMHGAPALNALAPYDALAPYYVP
jgi:hypothetical protein